MSSFMVNRKTGHWTYTLSIGRVRCAQFSIIMHVSDVHIFWVFVCTCRMYAIFYFLYVSNVRIFNFFLYMSDIRIFKFFRHLSDLSIFYIYLHVSNVRIFFFFSHLSDVHNFLFLFARVVICTHFKKKSFCTFQM
jgi:hypothetical protein